MASKKKVACCISAVVIATLVAMIAAGVAGYFIYKHYQKSDGRGKITVKLSDSLENFSSDKEFDKYVKEIEENQKDSLLDKLGTSMDGGLGLGDVDMSAPLSTESKSSVSESESSNENITNVQETGVDEGDIVKTYKDYFVILRRGRIFTVKNYDGENTLKKIDQIDAYPDNYTKGTWYDEMLIKDDLVMVIGYSYSMSATEVGLFDINTQGKLKHLNTYFIDSNDYYSSRNYASRLVDDKLIFYMPYYLYSWDYSDGESKREMKLPQIKKWQRGNETTNGQDILKKTDIYKPVQDISTPTLHTVVSCDISRSNLDCSAKAIMGPYSRSFYVSPNAIYTWISDISHPSYSSAKEERDNPDSYVYMIKIDDMSARALRADGSPIDQFSFKEEKDHLNVMVSEYSAGDAMWNPETTSGELALFRVSLDEFTNEPVTIDKDHYAALPETEGYTMQNRFVGDYLLYGSGSNWYQDDTAQDKLYAKKFASSDTTKSIDLPHSVDRIDIIGDGAIVVGNKVNGNNDYDLKFSAIELEKSLGIRSTYTVPNASQGELRSHGFSYKDRGDGTGIAGLPIRREGQSYEHLFNESAEVLFLKVNKDKNLSRLGSLQASPPSRTSGTIDDEDNCKYSCVDWYGNSRPIFYKDRVIALLGYEIIEGELADNKVSEKQRLNYSP